MTHPPYTSPSACPVSGKRPINTHPVHNRIRSFMEHSTRYAFKGEVRLARDCGVSCAAISRLIAGKSCPSFPLIVRIGQAFEKQFRTPIDLREIVSLDGTYPTSTVCQLTGCRGCTAQSEWNEDDTFKAAHLTQDQEPTANPKIMTISQPGRKEAE